MKNYLIFGGLSKEEKQKEKIDRASTNNQIVKDFELIEHEGLFFEYLEMGFKFFFNILINFFYLKI